MDDVPYGGGAGMVMRSDVVGDAVDSMLSVHKNTKFIYMTPSGTKFNQNIARELLEFPHITILCGRFEGIDQRIIDAYTPYELSIEIIYFQEVSQLQWWFLMHALDFFQV